MEFHKIKGAKILLTGASGFIGSALAKKLLSMGAEVYSVSRNSIDLNKNIRWYKGDLTDLFFVETLFQSIRPDYIVHLAGYVYGARGIEHVLPAFSDNLVTSLNLLLVHTQYPSKRIVFGGSFLEYDPNTPTKGPASPYNAAKLAASQYARMFHTLYGVPVCIASLFMVYGPGQRDNTKLIPHTILKILNGETPKLTSGKHKFDWVYVEDVADALIRMLTTKGIEGQTLDVGTGILTSSKELVMTIVEQINPSIHPAFGALQDRHGEQERKAQVNETFQKIGWRPKTDLPTGLQKTIAYYKSHRI
jgi:UDP-glucose 4-epimerase